MIVFASVGIMLAALSSLQRLARRTYKSWGGALIVPLEL